jgi:hypothetical protein
MPVCHNLPGAQPNIRYSYTNLIVTNGNLLSVFASFFCAAIWPFRRCEPLLRGNLIFRLCEPLLRGNLGYSILNRKW